MQKRWNADQTDVRNVRLMFGICPGGVNKVTQICSVTTDYKNWCQSWFWGRAF
ncbi:hypothetical protein CES86_4788 [Brucella lupini]|uniref:Uncharacterized protein n=1 Tax=Brucella lupini TaxID=255457 RepID=A0A256GBK0_9HYPH|nr:hypothetical protein CES86_4788 [Brucella lupini]